MLTTLALACLLLVLNPDGLRAQAHHGDRLLGEFGLVAMNSGGLPVASPDHPGQLIHSLTLRLSKERFELGSTFSVEGGEVEAAPLLTGPYDVTAEELRFRPTQAKPGTVVAFRYGWDGARLLLTDGNGHQWAMARQEALVSVLREFHLELKGLVTRAAEAMPAEGYGFRAATGTRTFGELVAQVADANLFLCPPASGGELVAESSYVPVSVRGRDELVRTLRASYELCEQAFSQTDAEANITMGELFGQPRTRFYAMQLNVTHSYALYGDIRTTLRAKGLTLQ